MQLSMFDDGVRLSSVTPIRYFGGKQKARNDILKCYPSDMKVLVSPFVGGGSVEILAASRGIQVKAFDKFAPLVRLWNVLLDDAWSVAERTYEKYPYPKELLREYVVSGSQAMDVECDIEFASIAWAMTQQCYGTFFMNTNKFYDEYKPKGPKRTPLSSVEYFNPDKWCDWGNDNLTVKCQSWESTLSQCTDEYLYVDPPYVGNEGRYGKHKNKDPFDHEGLANALSDYGGGWVLSYVEHPLIKELYSDFEIMRPRWSQGSVASGKKRKHDSAAEVYIIKPPCFNPLRVNK